MASQPPAYQLPLFYNGLAPLSSQLHPNHGLKPRGDLGFTVPLFDDCMIRAIPTFKR